ncbi:hypothetical protein CCHR01_01192 [Colletotrichum chrysophilum]|uniref:Uncharacterized protein n=1 Tax=Colletotrichum chrysophilum TaxID=1836956 RepID=A0AAD9EQK7_9PEZI|nr:hypothetical protein CCHR01_01192 [Colletotrichum chrysophilum]
MEWVPFVPRKLIEARENDYNTTVSARLSRGMSQSMNASGPSTRSHLASRTTHRSRLQLRPPKRRLSSPPSHTCNPSALNCFLAIVSMSRAPEPASAHSLPLDDDERSMLARTPTRPAASTWSRDDQSLRQLRQHARARRLDRGGRLRVSCGLRWSCGGLPRKNVVLIFTTLFPPYLGLAHAPHSLVVSGEC